MQDMTWYEWYKFTMAAPDLRLPRTQLCLHAGDVVLAHPLMAHDVAPNYSSQTRLAAIFRPFSRLPGFRAQLLSKL